MGGASTDEILEEAARLARQRAPFALTTVVWRRSPTSGRPGRKALVTADGRVRGWVGGACAEPAVVREALNALEEGTPRLLCLGAETDFPQGAPGRVVEAITCSSEGAMEIFIEPRLPRPQIAVVGASPLAAALASMARAVGFDVISFALEGVRDLPVDVARTDLDLRAARVDASSFVVVATMGQYDEEALAAALATDAPYVALVASRKRAAAVRETLRKQGLPDESLERIRAPAGLDLGPIGHEEIAVAVLAEIVQLKARGLGRAPVAVAPQAQAVDPVCGMTVTIETSRHRSEHEGTTYYFCCGGCRERFDADPAAFVQGP